jgi:hypothetical protein
MFQIRTTKIYSNVANLELHFSINFLVSIFLIQILTPRIWPRPKAEEICLWGSQVVYEKDLPLVWNSELNGNIIMNCEQGSIYRGRNMDC